MTYEKPDGVPIWLFLRYVAERVWMRDWPADWNCWRSIVEEDGLSPISARRNGKFSN